MIQLERAGKALKEYSPFIYKIIYASIRGHQRDVTVIAACKL